MQFLDDLVKSQWVQFLFGGVGLVFVIWLLKDAQRNLRRIVSWVTFIFHSRLASSGFVADEYTATLSLRDIHGALVHQESLRTFTVVAASLDELNLHSGGTPENGSIQNVKISLKGDPVNFKQKSENGEILYTIPFKNTECKGNKIKCAFSCDAVNSFMEKEEFFLLQTYYPTRSFILRIIMPLGVTACDPEVNYIIRYNRMKVDDLNVVTHVKQNGRELCFSVRNVPRDRKIRFSWVWNVGSPPSQTEE